MHARVFFIFLKKEGRNQMSFETVN